MARAETGVVAGLLQRVVEITVDKEVDPLLQRDLVASDRPVHLGLLACVEAVDVDIGAVAGAQALTQHRFVGEGALHQGDVAHVTQRLRAG